MLARWKIGSQRHPPPNSKCDLAEGEQITGRSLIDARALINQIVDSERRDTNLCSTYS